MMLSRIADSMFWLSRYMERVDNIRRSARYYYILSFDSMQDYQMGCLPLLFSYTNLGPDQKEALKFDIGSTLQYLITDATNSNSLVNLISQARENARGCQDKITKEVWEQVNHMYHYINNPALKSKILGDEVLVVLDELERQCLLFDGIWDSTMPRGAGWQFMNLGKYLERCINTIQMTDVYLLAIDYDLNRHEDLLYWRNLLFALSGYELYLKENRETHHSRQTVYQTIFNADFTRSVVYSLLRLETNLHKILATNHQTGTDAVRRRFGRLKCLVENQEPEDASGENLKHLIQEIRKQLWNFSEDFSRRYFSYA